MTSLTNIARHTATLSNKASHAASVTNKTVHTASLTNKGGHTASTTNQTKHGRFGDYTMAQLANTPITQWAYTTFDTITTILTNQSKH